MGILRDGLVISRKFVLQVAPVLHASVECGQFTLHHGGLWGVEA